MLSVVKRKHDILNNQKQTLISILNSQINFLDILTNAEQVVSDNLENRINRVKREKLQQCRRSGLYDQNFLPSPPAPRASYTLSKDVRPRFWPLAQGLTWRFKTLELNILWVCVSGPERGGKTENSGHITPSEGHNSLSKDCCNFTFFTEFHPVGQLSK